VDRLRPPLEPRVPGMLWALDPASLEDEARHEAVELHGAGELAVRSLTLVESELRGSLAGSRLHDLHLGDTTVAGADLANLRAPKAALRRVAVDQARLTGADLGEAALSDVTFSGCRIDLASLAAARLERVVFADCDLRESSFSEAVLRDVRFERCDLGGVELARVRLQRVELRGCRLDGINAVEDLRGAAMPWEDIVGNAGLFAAAAGVRPSEAE
jgi:uncharacterized protein YjbI with pentapeptide repeats